MKKDGWGATLKHLVYGEPQAAVDWLTKHAGEPGTDYTAASRLIREISKDDPAAATAWVSRLPEVRDAENGRTFHPVTQTFDVWLRTDAAAAGAWLAQQSTQAQWLTDLRARFANQNQNQ